MGPLWTAMGVRYGPLWGPLWGQSRITPFLVRQFRLSNYRLGRAAAATESTVELPPKMGQFVTVPRLW